MPEPKFFKGWAIPGASVPGGLETGPGETLDALSGHFKIFQLKEGHRFSTDDLLVAWYGTACAGQSNQVLDLGSGIGTVAMVTAWRLPGAKLVTIEAQAESVRLARKSVEYNGLAQRYELREGDLRDSHVLDPESRFELILGSPPYFPEETGIIAPHPQKAGCRFELRGGIEDYCLTASRHLGVGGMFAVVFPWAQRERLDQALEAAGLLATRVRDVVFREGEPPMLRLVAASLKSHLPAGLEFPWNEPPLTIRTAQGKIHPEYSAVKLAIGFPPA